MFTKDKLQHWFETNKIPLKSTDPLSEKEVNDIFIKAMDQSRSLGSFILMVVINYDRNAYSMSFESWDDLYDAYCAFMTGFFSKDNGPAN